MVTSNVSGTFHFHADIINNLQQHSSSKNTNTYAYYYSEVFDAAVTLIPIPDYIRSSANHGDDVPLTFGAPFMNDVGEPDLWKGERQQKHNISNDDHLELRTLGFYSSSQ